MGPRHFLYLLVLTLTVCVVGSAVGANQQFKFTVTPGSGLSGSRVDLHVLFDNDKDKVEGWAFGVCHDASLLTINSANNGADTQELNDGDGPDLIFYNIFPEDRPPGPGWNYVRSRVRSGVSRRESRTRQPLLLPLSSARPGLRHGRFHLGADDRDP